MEHPLTYIEQQLHSLMDFYPEAYQRILEPEELSEFIFSLIDNYSERADRETVFRESGTLISGDFFRQHQKDFVYNNFSSLEMAEYRRTFGKQTESDFISADYDISVSRQIRYMPAQWHYSSYFEIYFPDDEDCEVFFHSGEKLVIGKGDLLILAPYVMHATPCYSDGKYLEYFLLRSSSFDRVFWQQLNSTTIMSHFFRAALKNEDRNSVSYLLFHTGCDGDLTELISQIKKEIANKEKYSSQLINSLMSVLFCLLLRRYEDSVILPAIDNLRWKSEFTRIFSYIQDHYATASLQEVADLCGYSTKQVGRIIRHYFNMSFTDLITFIRMDNAVRMMKENTLSNEEIAAALGYSDLSSFYRAFKKYYRETPANYMKNEW